MRKIDLVIPTMWRYGDISKNISAYLKCNAIADIIIIDNDPQRGRSADFPEHIRVKVISPGRNIYVNAAWNEGVLLCKSETVCLLNDDIDVNPILFELISYINLKQRGIDLIGLSTYQEEMASIKRISLNRKRPIGEQYYGFGACMFMPREKYTPIPSHLKIWYGDDFLAHHANGIYLLSTPLVKGRMSATLGTLSQHPEIKNTIRADIRWAHSNLLERP